MAVLETAVATAHVCMVTAQVKLCHPHKGGNRYYECELDVEEAV